MQARSNRDRTIIRDAAKTLNEELLPRITGPIRFEKSLAVQDWESNGWGVTIAKFELPDSVPGSGFEIELWFDNFGTRTFRSFYGGFWCPSRRRLQRFVRRLPLNLAPEKTFRDDDTEDSPGGATLKVAFDAGDASSPVVELYDYQANFYGVYDIGLPGAASAQLDTAKMVLFFESVLRTFPEFDISGAAGDYSAIENRAIVASHLRRERDPELAKRCKKRDGYRCQVCTSSFEDRYGQIGHEFAEAHHVIPLRKIEGEIRTRLEDLITVCSNCHRMLHRLPGEPTDIEVLKVMLQPPHVV